MKLIFKSSLVLLFSALFFQSCTDKDDIAPPTKVEDVDIVVQDFIWKGLNQFYLWQKDVPDLADNRFASQAELNTFLAKYPVPEDLFDALRVDKSIDRFSWIVKDYLELEQALGGISKTDGIELGLVYKNGSQTEIFGFIRYVLPGSPADLKGLKRGDIFTAINGQQLTLSNYQSLLSIDSYTLGLADYNGGLATANGKTVDLVKTVLAENPILVSKVITNGSHKIGYLMYNGFYSEYDTQLNDAFGALKAAGVTDFVLDLRYNGGGSIQSSTRLASMITGQYTGKIYTKEEWNAKINAYFTKNDPTALDNNFVDKMGSTPINSLNLSKIYILTSSRTASASELVINGLASYIQVVQIGDATVGKNVGSITVYDSPDFGKTNRNPSHRYAMQPLVLRLVNSAGFGDYTSGLKPTFQIKENYGNLGVLGDEAEPLLNTAIQKITGTGRGTIQNEVNDLKEIKLENPFSTEMYLDKVPAGLIKALK